MRSPRQSALHQSIEELVHEPGCPPGRFLKDYRLIYSQGDSARDIDRLCGIHAWGGAAVQDAQAAGEVLLTMVNENGSMAEAHLDALPSFWLHNADSEHREGKC
ncbi:MAG: hypothetical protein WCA10_05455 [Terracidiphilus sp.]